MEPTPQVVIPLSPVTCGSWSDPVLVANSSPFTFRPKYILIPRDVAKDFLILQFKINGQAAFEWAAGEIPAAVFSGDCTPYLVRDIPSRIPLDQPVPLKLPVCRENQEIGLVVRNTSPAPRKFSVVILGDLVI